MALIRDVRVYAFLSPCRCGSIIGIPIERLQGWEGQRVQKPVREPYARISPAPDLSSTRGTVAHQRPRHKGAQCGQHRGTLERHSANNQSLLLVNFDDLGLIIALRISRWSPIEGAET